MSVDGSMRSALLDLRKIRYFVEIAECGSFTRAAANLGMAQSVMSRYMRDLEADLDLTLLHRDGRGATVTEVGLEFLERARHLLKQAEDLAADMSSRRGDMHGSAIIGIPPSVSHVLLPPFLEKVGREFPDMSIRIIEGFSGHVHEWLVNGRVDLAVLYNMRVSSAVIADRLLSEDMFLICASDDPLVRKEGISLPEIAALPLVLPGQPHGLRVLIEKAAHAQGVQLLVKIELDSLTTIKSLVRAGTARTILPLVGVVEDLESKSLGAVRIVRPTISREMLLASSSSRPSSRAKLKVARLLRQQISELVLSGRWPTSAEADHKTS